VKGGENCGLFIFDKKPAHGFNPNEKSTINKINMKNYFILSGSGHTKVFS
jgi:hypothetical protein